jgi:hypothetical protein
VALLPHRSAHLHVATRLTRVREIRLFETAASVCRNSSHHFRLRSGDAGSKGHSLASPSKTRIGRWWAVEGPASQAVGSTRSRRAKSQFSSNCVFWPPQRRWRRPSLVPKGSNGCLKLATSSPPSKKPTFFVRLLFLEQPLRVSCEFEQPHPFFAAASGSVTIALAIRGKLNKWHD